MQAGEVWCECKEHGSTVSKMLGRKKKKRSKSKTSSTFPLLSAVILLFYSAWSRWRSRSTRLPICLFQIRQHPSPLKTFHQHPDSRELSICHRLQTVWSGTQHQLDKTRLFKCKVSYNLIVNENPLWKCFSILNSNFVLFFTSVEMPHVQLLVVADAQMKMSISFQIMNHSLSFQSWLCNLSSTLNEMSSQYITTNWDILVWYEGHTLK